MRVEITYKFIMGFITVVASIVILNLLVPKLGIAEVWQQLVSTYSEEAEQAPDDVYKSSMLMRASEVELRFGHTSLCGQSIPLGGLIVALGHTVAHAVDETQGVLCLGQPLLGRHLVVLQRLAQADRHAVAVCHPT